MSSACPVRLLGFLLGLAWRRRRARTFFRRKLRSMGFEPDVAREFAAAFDPLPRLGDLFTGAMGRAGRGARHRRAADED